MQLHRSATHTAKLRVLVPIENLLALSCFLIEVEADFGIRLPQGRHLETRMVDDRHVDGIGAHGRSIGKWRDGVDRCPRLGLYRRLFSKGNTIAAVFLALKHQVTFAKHEPKFLFHVVGGVDKGNMVKKNYLSARILFSEGKLTF